jgi:hypothetical protein
MIVSLREEEERATDNAESLSDAKVGRGWTAARLLEGQSWYLEALPLCDCGLAMEGLLSGGRGIDSSGSGAGSALRALSDLDRRGRW